MYSDYSAKYGHISSECNAKPDNASGAGVIQKACYRCGQLGHLSSQCTETLHGARPSDDIA